MKRLNQTGDTIVEVMIAIVVISAVLGGAFTSARRSLNVTQQAKERDQAVRLVESQLERLKAANAGSVFGGASMFCLGSSLNKVEPECILDSTNQTHNPSASPSIPYTVSIERSGSGLNLTFTAKATWERSGGGGVEEAVLVYRAYQ